MKSLGTIAAVSAAAMFALAACSGSAGMIPQAASQSGQSGNVNPPPVNCGNAETATPGNAISAARGAFTRLNDDGSIVPYMPTVDDATRAHSFQAAATSSKQLTYMCGKIQPSQKIYVVFWGSAWNSGGDPDKEASRLKSFYSGLKASQWESAITQYYGPVGTYVANTTRFAGSYVDTAHQPSAHPTDAQVAAEAKIAAAHFGDYSIDASYVVAMPHAHNPLGFESGQYCAYHNSQAAAGGSIQFTNFPYIPDARQGCGAGAVTSPGTDDGVTIVAGHETAETSTDPIVNPNPTGWYNNTYGEIGDECAWTDLKNTKFSTGTYPTQPLWSNKANGCVQ